MKRFPRNISRPTLITAATLCALLSPFASADARDRGANRHTTYGKVIHVEPIYRKVVVRTPIEQCWTEDARYVVEEGYTNYQEHDYQHDYRNAGKKHHSRRSGDTVAGTIIGGVIGNQLGRNGSRGARTGATIAGAIIGSVVANEFAGGRNHYGETHRRHRHHGHHYDNHAPSTETVYGVRPVQHCKTIIKKSVRKKIDGYHVTYLHRGHRLQTRTRKKPGSRIALNTLRSPAVWR